MPEEVITDTPAEVELGNDGTVLDPARQQNTITKMRALEKDHIRRIHALESGVRELSRGIAVDPALLGDEPADTEVTVIRQAFLDVGAALGLDAETVSGDGGNVALLEAAKQARIAGPLAVATTRAGVDHDLTAALLGQSGALASLDLSGDVGEQLADAIRSIKDAHPNVAVRSSVPAVSSFPIGAGSNGAPGLPISREALAYLPAAEVNRLRQSGALSHLDVAPDR